MATRKGIREQNRDLLERLHRATAGPFSAAKAAELLSLSRERARRLLAYFASRGWLSRVRRGTYVTVPLGATVPSKWRADPWTVAHEAFSPCYIAGWSASEHWELTEQIFRSIVVITCASIRKRERRIQGTVFILKSLREEMHFGTRSVWRKQTRVRVSDPSRTVVDILDDPEIGGGIRHCADVVAAYFESEYRSDEELLKYIERRGNRTVLKRLGYLIEALDIDAPDVIGRCRAGQSKGISALDPTVAGGGRIVKRWNLRVNVTIGVSKERL
ncbi:MAG: type IV toxin-antitoxin system AbiEi family antitoxin domain-containing protein [Rhodothermia bacterium]